MNPGISRSIKWYHGLNTETNAEIGAEALKKLKGVLNPDIILMDLEMPGFINSGSVSA